MCTQDGCTKSVHAKGLCQAHYRQAQRRSRGLKKPGPRPDPTKPHSKAKPKTRKLATESECANGHRFTPQNTYVYPEGHPQAGDKVCRICRRNSQRKYKGLPEIPDNVPVGPWNRDKTHCLNNHPYDEVNTGRKADGSRYCKRCRKGSRIEKTYGITLEVFEQMLADQGNACKICRLPFAQESDAHLDHCHASGINRALLCSNCNNGLGRFLDNPDLLRAAADYLEEFGYEVIPS